MGQLSNSQLKKRADSAIDLINAAHMLDEGKELVSEKDKPLWREILRVAPHSVFDHPERHWEIETYVKSEIEKHGEYIRSHVLHEK
jgi:hypothetical protein